MDKNKKEYSKLEAVKSIIGNFESVGETYADNESYDNLVELKNIIIPIIEDLREESINSTRAEYSMHESGKLAYKILADIRELIEDYEIK